MVIEVPIYRLFESFDSFERRVVQSGELSAATCVKGRQFLTFKLRTVDQMFKLVKSWKIRETAETPILRNRRMHIIPVLCSSLLLLALLSIQERRARFSAHYAV